MAIKTINSLSHMRAALASSEQPSECHPEDGSEEFKVPIAKGSFLQDQQSLLRSLEREVGCSHTAVYTSTHEHLN